MKEKWTKTQYIIFTACLIITMMVLSIVDACETDKVNIKYKLQDEEIVEFKLNQKNLYNKLLELDIKHPKIVLKQAICETGWFKSKICKVNYNLFGFHNGKHYLKFKDYNECILYYKEWQHKHYNNNQDYYKFLDEYEYAADSNYVETLKKIKINV